MNGQGPWRHRYVASSFFDLYPRFALGASAIVLATLRAHDRPLEPRGLAALRGKIIAAMMQTRKVPGAR